MFDNIEKYWRVIKFASSMTGTGYVEEGYSTITTEGNNVVVTTIVDTHDEYKKNITIKIDDGYNDDYDEYYMDYEDVYHALGNNTVNLSGNDPIYKACVSDNFTNHNDNNILRDKLMKYITKCFNINENLTLNIIRDFPGASTGMKIRAFSTMIRLVEKNQEVVNKDSILQESINAMDTYIQNLG